MCMYNPCFWPLINILPLDISEAITDYQLLCMVITKLNQLIKNVQANTNNIDEIQKEIEELKQMIANLPIYDEVSKKLDEMLADGTLNVLASYLLFPATLGVNEVVCQGTKHYYSYNDNIQAIYGASMGVASTNNTILVSMIPIEYKLNYLTGSISNLATIREYDKSFNLIRESSPLTLYHGQSMVFYEGKIYANANSSGNELINKIIVIDYMTLTVDSVIDISEPSNFIYFQNGYMYTGTRSHIEQRNLDGSLVSSLDLSSKNLPPLNSLEPYQGGYLASLVGNNSIVLLDSKFNISKIFSLWGKYNIRGEIKDFTVFNDDIYFGYNDRTYCRQSDSELTEVYFSLCRTNLNKNVQNFNGVTHADYARDSSCYVDTSSSASLQTGSPSSPYATIMQAVAAGFKEIILVNCDGCYITGSDINIYINTSSSPVKKIYFGKLVNSIISGSNVTIMDPLNLCNIKGCNIEIGNANIQADIVSNYSNLNFYTSPFNLIEGYTNNLTLPTSNPSIPQQKFDLRGSTPTLPVKFSSLADIGLYHLRMRISCNGNIFIANISGIGTDTSQYFATYSYFDSDSQIHSLIGYVSLRVVNSSITCKLSHTELDGVITNAEIQYFKILHLM